MLCCYVNSRKRICAHVIAYGLCNSGLFQRSFIEKIKLKFVMGSSQDNLLTECSNLQVVKRFFLVCFNCQKREKPKINQFAKYWIFEIIKFHFWSMSSLSSNAQAITLFLHDFQLSKDVIKIYMQFQYTYSVAKLR
jgi:hypothetical protein